MQPYDLIIFDEAHKLSVDRGNDLRVRKTERYKLAEALCGVADVQDAWRLPWAAHHVLLLTATPHQGKDYPYYALWRLLEPEVLATPEAFNEYPADRRQAHFIRRTKEEMVHLNGKPCTPPHLRHAGLRPDPRGGQRTDAVRTRPPTTCGMSTTAPSCSTSAAGWR